MRKIQGIVFSIILFAGMSSFSADTAHVFQSSQVGLAVRNMTLSFVAAEGLNWKIGDALNFDLRIKPIPVVASASLQVTKIDKDGITLVEILSYKTLKQIVETVLDPNTGQVKSTKINGKPAKVPSAGETKIVNEEESHIKVKAGEFDCIHVVMEGAGGSQSEIWINPAAIPITGMLKSSSVASFLTIELELASFVHGK